MLFTCEPLLLRRGDHFAIFKKRGGGVMIERRYPQYVFTSVFHLSFF